MMCWRVIEHASNPSSLSLAKESKANVTCGG